MTRVSESAKLYVPASRVWEVVGDFTAIAGWHPGVLNCEEDREGTQVVRRLNVGAEAPVVERLEDSDDEAMSHTYSLVSGPLPVRDYRATLEVVADDETSCTLHWSSAFEPDGVPESEAVAAVQAIYRAGLDHLRFKIGG